MESKVELNEEKTLNIIATECIHGCMDKMYKDIQEFEKQNKKKIDLVLCTGDFESMRNEEDLHFFHVQKNIEQWEIFINIIIQKSKHHI